MDNPSPPPPTEPSTPPATTLSDFFDNLLDDEDTDHKSAPSQHHPTSNTNHTTISIPDMATQTFIDIFLSEGFKYISVCEGAWPACHRYV